MNLQKYAVILHNREDLEDFYNDMETEGGSITIPDRAVDVDLRKPTSRVTYYMLTPEEAALVKDDARVQTVEFDAGMEPVLQYRGTRRGRHNRNIISRRRTVNNASDMQWGLWRHTVNRNETDFNTGDERDTNIVFPYTGKNVDVVILDDQAWQPDHLEFLDDDGNSRVVNYNWWQHASEVGDGTKVGRIYNQRGTPANFHNIHCAGTVAGRNEGWAKDANIYFFALNFSGNDQNNSVSTAAAYDYIRAFHRNKPINPETGRKNPTIVNNSWGYNSGSIRNTSVASVNYNGEQRMPGGGEGEITYNGYYGAYDRYSRIVAQTGDPENQSLRFTTSGTDGGTTTDRMVAWPEDWEKIPNQTYSFSQTDPTDNYEITVLTPCDVQQNSRIIVNCNSPDSYIEVTRIVNNGASIRTRLNGPNIEYNLTGGFGFSRIGQTGEVSIRYLVEVFPADDDELEFDVAWTVTTGERGQFFGDITEESGIQEFTDEDFNPDPEFDASGSVIVLPHNPIASVANLTADTIPSSGGSDDGYWNVNLPFSVNYLGSSYTSVGVGTNSLLMFGGRSSTYRISSSTPSIPKIMVGAGDRRGYVIFTGTEGEAPNRTFRIVWEGNNVYARSQADPSNPTMRWEVKFYEATPDTYDVIWDQNGAKSLSGGSVFTPAQLQEFGLNTAGRHTAQNAATDADIVDAIADGIIVVASAGNGRVPQYSASHPYYNNYATLTSGSRRYYHRPPSPAHAGTGTDSAVITVGALDIGHRNDKEQRVYFSNFGEAVDIYAAGHYVQSAMPDLSSRDKVDRNGGNYYAKVSGTSMSGPQVCGILACFLEKYPDMTQKQARELLSVISTEDDMYDDPTGTYDFANSLEGSPNRVLAYPEQRKDDKPMYPKIHKGRPVSGVAYPRRQIKVRKA